MKAFKSKMSFVYRLALLLSLFVLVGCAAVQPGSGGSGIEYSVSPGDLIQIGKFQTMNMVQSALAGAWWSTILTDPTGTKFIIVWPMQSISGVAFFVWDSGKIATISTFEELARLNGLNRAQLGDIEDVSNMVSHLQNKGWKIIDAATIQAAVKSGLLSVLKTMNRLDTFYIIPINPNDPLGMDAVQDALCDPDGDGVSNCGVYSE